MKNTLETRLGVFFALTFIAAVLVLQMAGGTDIFKPSYRLRARFVTAQELKKGDIVKMAGVEIGRVEDIHFADNEDKVEIILKLKRGVAVKDDSKATIKPSGLLGQTFVSLSMGASKTVLEPNMLIQTAELPELSAIMEKLNNVASGIENVTKSFSGEQIQNILGPFRDFMIQNRTNLTATISNLTAVSGSWDVLSRSLTNGTGTVGKLLTDETLYNSALKTVNTLNDTAADIKGALGDAKGMITDARLALGDARKSIGKVEGIFDNAQAAVKEAQDTLTQAKLVVTEINEGKGTLGKLAKDPALFNEATLAMTNLREILQKVNQGQGTIGKFVNDESFFKNAKMTLQKLDKATEELEDSGPLSVLGSIVGKLF